MNNSNPYKIVYMPSHPKSNTNGCIYEHVLIAEKILGRQLTNNEVVHHIDKNEKNNNIDNLMVFASNSDHMAYHNGCEIYNINNIWYAKRKTKICEYCKKEFEPSYTRKHDHVYCCQECAKLAQTKTQGVSKEYLYKLLLDLNGNFSKAGREIGCTDNAIRKICKKYGLSTHSKDYKR